LAIQANSTLANDIQDVHRYHSRQHYERLDKKDLLPVKQKGRRKNTRGTKDKLLIDKILQKNCRRRHTNFNIPWTDYKKAYHIVPHSWLLESVMLTGLQTTSTAIKEQHGNWRTDLQLMEQCLVKWI